MSRIAPSRPMTWEERRPYFVDQLFDLVDKLLDMSERMLTADEVDTKAVLHLWKAIGILIDKIMVLTGGHTARVGVTVGYSINGADTSQV